jgi:hypothetical protein
MERSFEKYFLIDFDGKTKLHTEVQVEKEWQDHMNTGLQKDYGGEKSCGRSEPRRCIKVCV